MIRGKETCKSSSQLLIGMRYIIRSGHVQHKTTLPMLIRDKWIRLQETDRQTDRQTESLKRRNITNEANSVKNQV